MRKGAATKSAILDEAAVLAAEIGLGGLTIGSLATRTDLSKSGLFAHFGSKETLQLQVLERYEELFTAQVIRPALRGPRGEPRLRLLFEGWLSWAGKSGGCPLLAATFEFDDQPGPVREHVVATQRDWIDTVSMVCEGLVSEGHIGPAADARQLAFGFEGIMVSFHVFSRLLDDPAARERARRAFDDLLAAAR